MTTVNIIRAGMLSACIFVFSCTAIREAKKEKQIRKAENTIKLNKDQFADFVNKEYPIRAIFPVDTMPITKDSAYRASLQNANEYILLQQEYIDSLKKNVFVSDSAGQIDQLQTIVDLQQRTISELQNRINHIPPKEKEVPKPYPVYDSAREQSWRNKLEKCQTDQKLFFERSIDAGEKALQAKDDEKKWRTRFWIAAIAAALSLIILLLLLIAFIRKGK